jgi:hypothetical protein
VHDLEDASIVRPHEQHVEQLTVSCFHLGVHGDLPILAGMPEKSFIVSHWLVDSESMRSQNHNLQKKCGNSMLCLLRRFSLASARHAQKGSNLEIQTTTPVQLCKWEGKRRKEHKFGIGEIYVRFACIFLGS